MFRILLPFHQVRSLNLNSLDLQYFPGSHVSINEDGESSKI